MTSSSQHPGDPQGGKTPRRLRVLRWLGWGVSGLTLLVVLFLVSLLFRSVRQPLLEGILRHSLAALPGGGPRYQELHWPKPGRLDVKSLLWIVADDTLLEARRLVVDLRLKPLLKRDLRLRELSMEFLSLNLPAFGRAFPAGPDKPAKRRTFPRDGSYPPLPSISCDRLELGGGWLRLDSMHVLDGLQLSGSLEVAAGREPGAVVRLLHVSMQNPRTELTARDLNWTPLLGRLDGLLVATADPGWSLVVNLSSPADDQVRLEAALGDSIRQALGLDLHAGIRREGATWQGLALGGGLVVARTTELATLASLVPALGNLPDLDALQLSLDGELAWLPRYATSLGLSATPNPWLRTGQLHMRQSAGSLDVDTLLLAFPGLRVAASGRLSPDSLGLLLRGELRSSTELRSALSLTALPEGLRAGLTLHAERVRGQGQEQSRLGGRLSFHVEEQDLRLRGVVRMVPGPLLIFLWDTLRVEDTQRPSGTRAESGGGRLTRTDDKTWRAEPLVLAGVLGRLSVKGGVDSLSSGTVDLLWSLDRLAPVTARRLGLADSLASTLDQALANGDPATLSAHVRFRQRPAPARPRLHLAGLGRLELPGPARLAALLPPTADLSGLGDLSADFTLDWTGNADASHWLGSVEASAAGWLDQLSATLRGQDRTLQLDTLITLLPGASLHGAGWRGRTRQELRADWTVANLALATRFVPALATAEANLAGEALLCGRPGDPYLDLLASGSWRQPGLDLPSLQLAVRRDSLGLAAAFWAPGGLNADNLRLDTLAGRFTGPAGPKALLFPGRLWLKASGEALGLETALSIRHDPGWVLEGNQLDLRIRQEDLATRRSFRLEFPVGGGLRLDSLDMAGSLGLLQAEAALGPDSADSHVKMHLEMETGLPIWPAGIPPGVLPRHASLDLLASDLNGLQAHLLLTGLRPLAQRELDLSLHLDGALARPDLRAAVFGDGDTVMTATGQLPAALVLWPPSFSPSMKTMELDMAFRNFPLVMGRSTRPRPDDLQARMNGTLQLSGTSTLPNLEGSLVFDAPEDHRLKDYLATLEVGISKKDSLSRSHNLHAELGITRGNHDVAQGHLRLPVQVAGGGGAMVLGSLDARLVSPGLDLKDLNALLPEDMWLAGKGRLDLQATGWPTNPDLAGQVELDGLDLRRGDGTHVYGGSRMFLEGRASHPVLKGWLQIDNGEIRVKELPRNLHDTSGTTLLWALEAERDSLPPEEISATAAWRDSLELDMTLRIPNGVRLRRGELDVEGSGTVTVRRVDRRMTLLGELRVLNGQFRLLGRQFNVETGTMTWFGDENLAPRMDLELAATVGDTRVLVHLTGPLGKPVLELRSEPPLDEGEIMALLLFERGTEELDAQQQDIYQRQATQLAADYGMAALQARLSRSFHIDLLRWEADGLEGGSSLLVGKYLGPRVLVRYEQSLNQQDLFRLNVEYILSRHLRLETSTGNRGESGLVLNWSRSW